MAGRVGLQTLSVNKMDTVVPVGAILPDLGESRGHSLGQSSCGTSPWLGIAIVRAHRLLRRCNLQRRRAAMARGRPATPISPPDRAAWPSHRRRSAKRCASSTPLAWPRPPIAPTLQSSAPAGCNSTWTPSDVNSTTPIALPGLQRFVPSVALQRHVFRLETNGPLADAHRTARGV